MSALSLRLAAAPDFDIDMSGITPDALQPLRLTDIRRLRLRQGTRTVPLGDLFEIDGAAGGDELELLDATPRLQRVGSGMAAGLLRVQGRCGHWLGADMRGGTLLVGRHAGARVGDRMRRGLIVIGGNAGRYCGSQMIAGSIVVLGEVSGGIGSGMRRGTIALLAPPADLGSNFVSTGRYELAFTQLLVRHVAGLKSAWRKRLAQVGAVERWVGDAGAAGLGEILVMG
jgi:formylmethanofuran dehydrogenase subunit C